MKNQQRMNHLLDVFPNFNSNTFQQGDFCRDGIPILGRAEPAPSGSRGLGGGPAAALWRPLAPGDPEWGWSEAGRAGRPAERGGLCGETDGGTQRDTLSRSRSQVLISRDGLCCSPSPSGEARSRGRAQARQGPTLNPLLQRSLHSYTCGSLSLGNQIKTVSGDAT